MGALGTCPLCPPLNPALFAAVVYIWLYFCSNCVQCEGHYSSKLLFAKSRVTPLSGYTVQRSELCGAVLISRLMLAVAAALSKMKYQPMHY